MRNEVSTSKKVLAASAVAIGLVGGGIVIMQLNAQSNTAASGAVQSASSSGATSASTYQAPRSTVS